MVSTKSPADLHRVYRLAGGGSTGFAEGRPVRFSLDEDLP
jgi:hypothetical protein